MNEVYEHLRAFFPAGTFWQWFAMSLIAAAIAFIVKVILRIPSARLRRVTERTSSAWDDVAIDIMEGLKSWVLFILTFYFLTTSLERTEAVQRVFLVAAVFASIFQVGIWGLHLLRNWKKSVLNKKIEHDPSSAAALGLFYTATQAVFIVVLILVGLSNLGINISALLAGLGVGGIAVALAAQNVLGDLLASLSIVLDKPFVVGDFIIAGTEMGTVEQIGIKTTRLRSLSGEEVVLSNKDLLESRIRNYKRMWQRRVVQKFGVVYSTPANVLEQIPGWVKEIIGRYDKLRFDRCHFANYGASSLDFEFVFFVIDPEYNVLMDFQQKVLLDIFRKFAENGVEFAFPTQSIYVEKLPEK